MAKAHTIWITFQREGIHCYPEAATNENLKDVAFLANSHRHIFHFHVEVPVDHDNRDIEFIQFKRWCEGLYTGVTLPRDNVLQLDNKSCEMIATRLAERVIQKYGVRWVKVSVSEDNENGATVYLEKDMT